MNEGAVKFIRRCANVIKDPKLRAQVHLDMTNAWKQADHKEKGRLRRVYTYLAKCRVANGLV